MQNQEFHYEYTAPTAEERKEIVSIRKKYEPKQESKLDTLRALDRRVKNIPKAVALSVGVLFCLLFGLGLAMILEWSIWWGVPVALVGGLGMASAYPLYKRVYTRMQKKYSEQILRVSKELLND